MIIEDYGRKKYNVIIDFITKERNHIVVKMYNNISPKTKSVKPLTFRHTGITTTNTIAYYYENGNDIPFIITTGDYEAIVRSEDINMVLYDTSRLFITTPKKDLEVGKEYLLINELDDKSESYVIVITSKSSKQYKFKHLTHKQYKNEIDTLRLNNKGDWYWCRPCWVVIDEKNKIRACETQKVANRLPQKS